MMFKYLKHIKKQNGRHGTGRLLKSWLYKQKFDVNTMRVDVLH